MNADCTIRNKPSSIMVTSNNLLKIVDFGMANSPEGCGGTWGYFAPEWVLPKTGTASDWWSFGVILFVMFTGSLPYYDLTQATLDAGPSFNNKSGGQRPDLRVSYKTTIWGKGNQGIIYPTSISIRSLSSSRAWIRPENQPMWSSHWTTSGTLCNMKTVILMDQRHSSQTLTLASRSSDRLAPSSVIEQIQRFHVTTLFCFLAN